MPLHDLTFPALSGSTCRKVLDALRRGPQSVAQIHASTRLGTRSNVSQALARLLKAELVSVRRLGRNSIYQIRPGPFEDLARYCMGLSRDARRNR